MQRFPISPSSPMRSRISLDRLVRIETEAHNMQVSVAYDVATEKGEDKRRLHKVAQICKNYGQRVQ